MKETILKSNNKFKILSGVTKAINASSTSYQKGIVLQSEHLGLKRIHGVVLRYKEGLEDVGVNIQSHSIKKIIEGYCPISVLGSPYGADSFNIFPFQGKKPLIKGKETIEISFQSQATPIAERDISVSLLVEELEDSSELQTDKNPFYILAGSCDPVGTNKRREKAISLANDFSSDVKIHGVVLRYKEGLDNVGIDLSFYSSDAVGGIIQGDMTLANLGSRFKSSSFNFFPLPGVKSILGQSRQIDVLLSTNSTAINARDVGIALIVEGK